MAGIFDDACVFAVCRTIITLVVLSSMRKARAALYECQHSTNYQGSSGCFAAPASVHSFIDEIFYFSLFRLNATAFFRYYAAETYY